LVNGGDIETLLMFELNSANLPFSNPSSGPDGGGYYWSSSSADTSLDFSWIDIENSGTQVQFTNNDDSPNPISIGFNFPFFDSEYSEVLINPNGWIGFGGDSPSWSNISIPNGEAPKPAIMAMWDDLNPINDNGNTSSAGNVYYYNDTENDYFVIWYDNVVTWQNNAIAGEFDFQVTTLSSNTKKSFSVSLHDSAVAADDVFPLSLIGFKSSHIAIIAGFGASPLGILMFDQLGLSPPNPIQPFGLIKTSEYSLSKNGKLNPIDIGFGESSLLVN
jgi:hypothetical protein